MTLTLRGEAVLRAGDREYRLREGSAVRLPPGVEHIVEVISDEWVVVTAYCDECALPRPDVAIPPRSITADPLTAPPDPVGAVGTGSEAEESRNAGKR